jgi:hypothetical protein
MGGVGEALASATESHARLFYSGSGKGDVYDVEPPVKRLEIMPFFWDSP